MFIQLLSILLTVHLLQGVVNGVTPIAEIYLKSIGTSVYATPAKFSSDLPSDLNDADYNRLFEPTNDNDGCAPDVPHVPHGVFYLLVSRGNCSFAAKTEAAENVGASGIIVYNSLEGIYAGQNYASETDYECDNGEGWISTEDITLPVYSDEMTSIMPAECTSDSKCSSGKCVFTNTTLDSHVKVCCAWDLYITMGSSSDDDDLNVPAVFITMSDYDTLKSYPSLDNYLLTVKLFYRSTSIIDLSSVIIWVIAIITILMSAVSVVKSERSLFYYSKIVDNDDDDDDAASVATASTAFTNVDAQNNSAPIANIGYGSTGGDLTTENLNSVRLASTIRREAKKKTEEDKINSNTFEITPAIGIAFIVGATLILVLLYYVDLYYAVVFVYIFSSIIASTYIYYPIFKALVEFVQNGFSFSVGSRDMNTVKEGDMFENKIALGCSSFFSISVATVWFIYKYSDWSWILQDIMSVTLCSFFLTVVLLPNLKTATILLLLAFLYDIFFVFFSKYIFSDNVMVEVASGTSYSHDDENFCEKYPTDSTCYTSQLPMRVVVPSINTWYDGESMLGLGDIVLPGLLVVFCARYDARRFGSLRTAFYRRGYLLMALLGYSLGLFCADVAVEVFETGQPALLYIVPLTLFTVLYRSYRATTIYHLWNAIPAFNIVARQIGVVESEYLLGRSDIVEAVVSFHKPKKDQVINSIRNSTSTGLENVEDNY